VIATAATRRPRSVPERLALVAVGLVPAAFVYPWLSERTALQAVCPLRTLTTVPCPLCGGTTAATALADGRVGDAFAANPLVPLLALAALATVALVVARAVGRAPSPTPWGPAARRWALAVAVVAATASWGFQLQRLGVQ
jgi:Protein of unknown function (DUF2752)